MSSSGVFFRLDRGVLFGTRPGWSWNATPFWQLKIQSSNDNHSADDLVLYDNAIHSSQGILFNGIISKQNHTAADVFLNCLRYFTMIESMVGFPLLPPPHLLSFFRKHFNISHARCSRVRYQSIHESQIINIS